jgi:hypothetical protein
MEPVTRPVVSFIIARPLATIIDSRAARIFLLAFIVTSILV